MWRIFSTKAQYEAPKLNFKQMSNRKTKSPNDAKPVLPDVTPEMKNFAQEYSLWVITYGQIYINALSPKFEVDNEPMEIFLSKYYGKNWVNGLVK